MNNVNPIILDILKNWTTHGKYRLTSKTQPVSKDSISTNAKKTIAALPDVALNNEDAKDSRKEGQKCHLLN